MNAKLIATVEFLKNLKCKNLSTFDLSENGEEKFFVVLSAANCDETKKIADEVCTFLKYDGERDGYHKGEWIIINAEPIIVHIFTAADRAKYNLDRLYKSKEVDILKSIKKKKSK